MVVYVKVKGDYKTLKEIAIEYNVPYKLVSSRYTRGVRDIKELTQPKWEMLRK